MRPPLKLTPHEWRLQLKDWLTTHTFIERGVVMCCKGCFIPLSVIDCCVSIHAQEFEGGCAGNGIVEHVLIPFCYRCEGLPPEVGCVHVPYAEMVMMAAAPGISAVGWRLDAV